MYDCDRRRETYCQLSGSPTGPVNSQSQRGILPCWKPDSSWRCYHIIREGVTSYQFLSGTRTWAFSVFLNIGYGGRIFTRVPGPVTVTGLQGHAYVEPPTRIIEPITRPGCCVFITCPEYLHGKTGGNLSYAVRLSQEVLVASVCYGEPSGTS